MVAVYGGDGTVSEAASGLVGSNVPLAIFPGGTGNAIALALGIPGDLAAASALRSWRKLTSPMTSATGPPATAADPSAVDTTPSMPLAPRLERTVMALGVEGSQAGRAWAWAGEFRGHVGPQDGRAICI